MSKRYQPKKVLRTHPKHKTPRHLQKLRIKPTIKEKDARIDFIFSLIADRPNLSRYAIHQICCPRFNVVWETVDRYLAHARDRLRERLNRSREETRSNAVAFYEAVISNPFEKTENRLKAQRLLCELLGANAPAKLEVTGEGGGPVQGAVTAFLGGMSVDELKQVIGKLEAPLGDNKA